MLLDMLKSGAHDDGGDANPSDRSVCSFADVQNTAAKLGLGSSHEFIRDLLKIFSGLGAVSWFPKADKSLVVLKPQWLLDSMACLIREHEGKHSKLLHHLRQDQYAIPFLKEGMVKGGFFPVKLLEYVWQSSEAKYGKLEGKPHELSALKTVLEYFGLICRVNIRDDHSDCVVECYGVPALLPHGGQPSDLLDEFSNYANAQLYTCRWDFSQSKWLPYFVFGRLACMTVTSGRVDNVAMARTFVKIESGDAKLLLCLHADSWHIEARTVNYQFCPHASRLMLKLVQDGMDKIFAGLGTRVPHKVLLSTPDGSCVELLRLQRASRTVQTTARLRVHAEPLKQIWLSASGKCAYDSQELQPKIPTLTPVTALSTIPTPATTAASPSPPVPTAFSHRATRKQETSKVGCN